MLYLNVCHRHRNVPGFSVYFLLGNPEPFLLSAIILKNDHTALKHCWNETKPANDGPHTQRNAIKRYLKCALHQFRPHAATISTKSDRMKAIEFTLNRTMYDASLIVRLSTRPSMALTSSRSQVEVRYIPKHAHKFVIHKIWPDTVTWIDVLFWFAQAQNSRVHHICRVPLSRNLSITLSPCVRVLFRYFCFRNYHV